MSHGNRIVQYLVTFAVCLASVTTGVMLTWTTAAIPMLINNETDIVITKEQISWVAAMGSPGFVMGSLVSRYISDRFGRRVTILTSAIPVTIGTIFTVSSNSVWLLYFTRFLWGVGTGMVVTISPIYLAEISDKEVRGLLTVSSRFMFNVGNFLVMVIGSYVTYDTLNFMLLALPVMFFVACWFIPETPYYTLKEGKVGTAKRILKKLRTYKDDKELEEDLESMQKDVKKETLRSGSLKELFTGRQYRKAVIICIGLKLTQMLSGSVLILHYLGLIMQDGKIDIDLTTAFTIFGGVRIISGIISSMLADRVGRRPLLYISYLGSGCALALTAAYFYAFEVLKMDQNLITPYGPAAFAGIILAVILSTIGFNSLIYMIPAEMFPMNVKSVAMTSLNVFGGLSNFVIIKLFLEFMHLFGLFGVFTMFTTISLAGCVFSICLVPETKGKSLREILDALQGTAYDETAENLNKVTTIGMSQNEDNELMELKSAEQK